MPVKVLIIDDVATNRIVLKVKLATASYEVLQATTAEEALEVAQRDNPDVFVVAAELGGTCSAALITQLANLPSPSQGSQGVANIIALSETDSPDTRLELMQAGACDVLTKPLCKTLFLARMRSISRRRHERADLALSSDTADALGFDEAPSGFAAPGMIKALDPKTEAQRLTLKALLSRCPHEFEFCDSVTRKEDGNQAGAPDVMLVLLDGDEEKALSHLADLQLADASRHARLVAILTDPCTTLAGRALDLGADDVIPHDAKPEEVEIRLTTQVQGKRTEDALRRRLQNSLEAAITDPLTGLYNRRYALSALARLAGAVLREGGSFAVMIADLDHFKTVNDTYGHSAGDVALQRVAEMFQKSLEPGQIVSRFGGEEFLFLLPGADNHSAQQAADRLRLIVRDSDIFVPGRSMPIRLTTSIGVTVAQLSDQDGTPSVEALIGAADEALYLSKADGRDTVRFTRSSAA